MFGFRMQSYSSFLRATCIFSDLQENPFCEKRLKERIRDKIVAPKFFLQRPRAEHTLRIDQLHNIINYVTNIIETARKTTNSTHIYTNGINWTRINDVMSERNNW